MGIKRSLVGAYEEGRADPPLENLLKIAAEYPTANDAIKDIQSRKRLKNLPDRYRSAAETLVRQHFAGRKVSVR